MKQISIPSAIIGKIINVITLKQRQLNTKLIICIIFLSLISSTLFSQTIADKYDLNFQRVKQVGWDWMIKFQNTSYFLDNSQIIEGMHSLCFFYESNPIVHKVAGSDSLSFIMSRIIILPEGLKGDSCRLTLGCKIQKAYELKFEVATIDSKEVILNCKSLITSNTQWENKTLSFPFTGVRALRVRMGYSGTNDPDQRIWLSKVAINIDGKDISGKLHSAPSVQDSLRVIKRFEAKHLVPLSLTDNTSLLNNIKEFGDKKIIGLGEFCHGSFEASSSKIQFCKNLINSHNCKMVLLEFPQNMSLLFNLYVQNLIPEEYVGKMETNLRTGLLDYELYLDFIEWLRVYNKTAKEKVFLLGVDSELPLHSSGDLFLYFESLLGKEKGELYMELTLEKKYKEILEHAKTDENLKSILGEKNFMYLVSFLEDFEADKKIPEKSVVQRDFIMASRTKRAVDTLLEDDQKCAIFAHSGHVSKTGYVNACPPQKEFSLGSLLNEWYGNAYYSISFQAGEGTVLDEIGVSGSGLLFEVPLQKPPFNSFENVALTTGANYFYYPTKFLKDEIVQLTSISRPYIGRDYYTFAAPKKRFDAIVFIRKSNPLKNVGFKVVGLSSNQRQ